MVCLHDLERTHKSDRGTLRRDYGRFGFFFRRSLKKGETLTVHYLFVIERLSGPERTEREKEVARQKAQALYEEFAKRFKR